MAKVTLETIKNWFKTGLKPTEAQFENTWDSFRHKDDGVPAAEVGGLDALLMAKTEKALFDAHVLAETAHEALFALKENLENKGEADGYVPLNSLVKIASEYLTIVDDLTTGGSTALASAETVKTLKGLIDGINVILSSDNIDLDNVQELVDAIETVQLSLSTILVNDLTTGGTTKALTAEMGKSLKALIEALDFTQDLQSVIDTGGLAQSVDGASYIQIILNAGKTFLAQLVDGSNIGSIKATPARCFMRNAGVLDDAVLDINGGLASVSQSHIDGGNFFTTKVDFATPIANTNIQFPAKPAGDYVLATMNDLVVASTLNDLLIDGINYITYLKKIRFSASTSPDEDYFELDRLSARFHGGDGNLDLKYTATGIECNNTSYGYNSRIKIDFFDNQSTNAVYRFPEDRHGAGLISRILVTKIEAPTSSSDNGSLGETRIVGSDFYWFTGSQWLKVTGSTF